MYKINAVYVNNVFLEESNNIDPTDYINRTHRNELSVHAMNTSEECTVASKDCTKIEV